MIKDNPRILEAPNQQNNKNIQPRPGNNIHIFTYKKSVFGLPHLCPINVFWERHETVSWTGHVQELSSRSTHYRLGEWTKARKKHNTKQSKDDKKTERKHDLQNLVKLMRNGPLAFGSLRESIIHVLYSIG